MPVSIDDLIAEAVERMYRHPICILSYHARETLSHIAGSILSKGQTKDIRRQIVGRLQNIGYTGCKKLGFSAAWSGDDEDWSVYCLDCMSLLIIEGCEDGFEIFHGLILSKI